MGSDAANPSCVRDLETRSINAALELLSDKEPDEQQGTLIDVESERKAREAAEAKAESERQAREVAEQRAREFGEESNERRKKIRELQDQIDLLGNQPKPEPERIEVIPADYESAKKKAAELKSQHTALQKQLDSLQKEQAKIVKDRVAAKLHERQASLSQAASPDHLIDKR